MDDMFLSEVKSESLVMTDPTLEDDRGPVEESPEDAEQRRRHTDERHTQFVKHTQDLHEQHMKHRDDLHEQHKRHRDEAHKHNLKLAEDHDFSYAPAHYAYDGPSVVSPVAAGGTTSNTPGTSPAGGSTGAPA